MTTQPANANLVNHLRNFYSMGQLQIILMTYTDEGEIPDLPQREKQMRIDAIRQILSEPAPTVQPVIVEAEMKKAEQNVEPVKTAKKTKVGQQSLFG